MAQFTNILVATDCGPAAQHAADLACDIAASMGARVTLLHVWTVPLPAHAAGIAFPLDQMETAGREVLEAEAARVRARSPGVEVKTLLLPGVAWRVVLEAVEEHKFDLVVVGTHGRTGVQRVLIGSVAEKVVRSAPVPVLTVHAPLER